MAWPLAAMGIGALLGGMGAQQRGGNFLKGALTGAALGGVTGYLGGTYGASGAAGTKAGGIFGLGTKMLPNFLAMSGIGMGTEMFGQGEANRNALEGRRRMFQEEEEERLRRLSGMAGYDVTDPKRFLTPDKFFGRAARGGYQSRPQYQLGGPTSMEDDPAEAVNIQELQMDPGTMSPGGLTEEFDYMDEASLNPEIQKLYQAFLVANQTTEEEVPVEMFMQLMQQAGGQEGGGQGPMMAAEGGRVHAKRGRYMDPDDDEIRYDEDLIDIFEDDSAMFHGDYDVADEWKEGGIATVPRQNYSLAGLVTALSKLGRKGNASDTLKDVYERNMGAIDQDQEGILADTYERNMGAIDQDQEGIIADTGEGPSFEEIEDVEGPSFEEIKETWIEGDKPNPAGPLITLKQYLKERKKKSDWFENLEEKPATFDELMKLWSQDNPGENTGASGFMKRAVGDITEDAEELLKKTYEGNMGQIQDYMGKAKGGDVNRPGMFLGGGLGLGALLGGALGGAGLLSKIFGGKGKEKRSDVKSKLKEAPIFNIPRPIIDDEEDLPTHGISAQLLNLNRAKGGIADLDLRGGGASFGPGTGTSDDIPAMLSDGEFVVTANAVKNLGGGDRMEGARRMYSMMNQLDPNSQSPSEVSGVGYA